jgi:hypothetical protein
MQRTSSRALVDANGSSPSDQGDEFATAKQAGEADATIAVRRERARSRDGIDPELLRLYAELPAAMHAQFMIAGMLRALVKNASWKLVFAAVGLVFGGSLTLMLTHTYYGPFAALAATWAGAMFGGYCDERWRARARLRALRDEAERQKAAAEIFATGNRDGPAKPCAAPPPRAAA